MPVILYLDGLVYGLGRTCHDPKRGHNLRQAKLTFGVKLGQDGLKPATVGLEVNRAWDPEIAYRVGSAFVSVPSLGDRFNCGREFLMLGLIVKRKGVAPLEVVGGGFHLPSGLKRGRFAFGAYIVKH